MTEPPTETVDHLASPEELAANAAAVVRRANHRHVKVATVESCTGGLVGHALTDVPGASGCYLGGWIVYDNRQKVDLGVPADLLDEHGAVSAPVARVLAEQARRRSGADVAVSTTGIAGPAGGSEEKPVGTVFLGVATPDEVVAHHVFVNAGDRAATKRAFAQRALELLLAAVASVDPHDA